MDSFSLMFLLLFLLLFFETVFTNLLYIYRFSLNSFLFLAHSKLSRVRIVLTMQLNNLCNLRVCFGLYPALLHI